MHRSSIYRRSDKKGKQARRLLKAACLNSEETKQNDGEDNCNNLTEDETPTWEGNEEVGNSAVSVHWHNHIPNDEASCATNSNYQIEHSDGDKQSEGNEETENEDRMLHNDDTVQETNNVAMELEENHDKSDMEDSEIPVDFVDGNHIDHAAEESDDEASSETNSNYQMVNSDEVKKIEGNEETENEDRMLHNDDTVQETNNVAMELEENHDKSDMEDSEIPVDFVDGNHIDHAAEESDDTDFENDESTYWHRLEAGPDANHEDPDDPDSDHSDSEDSDPSSPDSDNDGDAHMSVNPRRLTRNCHSYANNTVKEVLAIVLSLSDRHNWTYEALIGCFNMLNFTLGCNYFPKSKKPLWQSLNRRSLGIKKHAYCKRCRRGLGRHKNLPDRLRCRCLPNRVYQKSQVPYFMELDLQAQLTQFLARPDAAQLMFSRENRQKSNADALEDIYDGTAYKDLRSGENPAVSLNDFTYTFNSDGFSCTKTSNVQVHPIYVKINELPQKVRQKHLFLAGVWIDRGDPDMVLYLQQALVRQGNKLATHGITWNAGDRGVITSKFIPTCCCVDSKARCVMLNMIGPTGYYGCTFCYIIGVQANGVHFPFDPAEVPDLRTNDELEAAMEAANGQPHTVRGVKGLSPLMNLLHFDLGKGMSTDDLHPLYEGCVKSHMELLLSENNEPYYIGAPQTLALIDVRLLSIKPPTSLSRTPRSIETRDKWRGHEWRNWILYYFVPCLLGLLPARYLNHLKKLSRAIYLVSRDSITEDDLEEASQCFIEYVQGYQNFFGVRKMTFNVHVLLHVVRAVRLWGPLHAHSTFNFESWNMKLRKHIKSMKDPLLQIVNRHLIHSFISSVPFDNENFSPSVQLEVASNLSTTDLKTAVRVGEVFALGLGQARPPSHEEQAALEAAGIVNYRTFTAYKRALYRGLEIRSIDYTRSSKTNNSFLYTWTDSFCRVTSVATIRLQNGTLVCVLFVQQLEVDGNDNIVQNIAYIDNELYGDVCVCQFSDVRAQAVFIRCTGYTYRLYS